MNIQRIEFRKVKKEEFDKLKRLFPQNDKLWFEYRTRRLQQFEENNVDIYVIEYDRNIIGEISVNYANSDLDTETIPHIRVYLEAFRLEDKYRGLGLGQKLMDYTINDLECKGYTEFTIGVEDDNKIAKHIYFKFGFDEVIDYGKNHDGSEYTLYLRDTKKLMKKEKVESK